MECPHCNQEHPEGTKFCPETGQKMAIIVGCTNKDCPNYGKSDIPSHYKFCPECGTKLSSEETGKGRYTFNPRKSISSVEDFRHGNIIIDGVMLGRTSVNELKQFKQHWKYKDKYELMDGNVMADVAEMTSEEYDDLLNGSDLDEYDNQQMILLRNKVIQFTLSNWKDISFFKEIGLDKYYPWSGETDKNKGIEGLLEDNGYIRIEHPFPANEVEDEMCFINPTSNDDGFLIVIDCIPKTSWEIAVYPFREWEKYYND